MMKKYSKKRINWNIENYRLLEGSFLKTKKECQNCKKQGDSLYIYQNELDKTCFQQDMAYGDSKDLPGRTASDKVLSHEAFNIAKNWKYDGLWFITFLIKGLLVLLFYMPGQRP